MHTTDMVIKTAGKSVVSQSHQSTIPRLIIMKPHYSSESRDVVNKLT